MNAPEPVEILERGAVDIRARIVGSSNATFLVTCTLGGAELHAIYKPTIGERELSDFSRGLGRREAAAAALSAWLGWDLVPETILRNVEPLGEGSLQRVVPEDGVSHYFTLREEPRWHRVLRRIAAFDVVVNNADRKSGHVLLATEPLETTESQPASERLWAIDHGLTFHPVPKLRTVIWDFAGDEIDEGDVAALRRLLDAGPPPTLVPLLHDDELQALIDRVGSLLEVSRLPFPEGGRPFPWPLV